MFDLAQETAGTCGDKILFEMSIWPVVHKSEQSYSQSHGVLHSNGLLRDRVNSYKGVII